jgi:diguanylate cyclase (GGDEF)-like protein/PAS domain S-box-containing protein
VQSGYAAFSLRLGTEMNRPEMPNTASNLEIIRVLLIEDNPADAETLERRLLEKHGSLYAVTHVESLDAALSLFTRGRSFEVALADLGLPDSSGLATAHSLLAAAPELPLIVLTGNENEALAAEAMRSGAQDYLVKVWCDGETIRRAIRYAIHRHAAEEDLKRSEARFRAIFENAPLGVALMDSDHRIVLANPALCGLMKVKAADLLGMSTDLCALQEDRAEYRRRIEELRAGRSTLIDWEKRCLRPDGSVFWTHLREAMIPGRSGQPPLYVALVEDIDAKRSIEERLNFSATVLETTGEAVMVTDAENKILHVNPAFEIVTGYTSEDVIGQDPKILGSGRYDHVFFSAMDRDLAEKGKWQGEIWNRRKTGELYASWFTINTVRDHLGRTIKYIAVFSDITSRKQEEERLAYLATHDQLTGLANRAMFIERVGRAIMRSQRNRRMMALFLFDPEHFKEINDKYGHLIGDQVLRQAAERLVICARPGDTAARLSGDNFALVAENLENYREASIIAGRIVEEMAKPFDFDGKDINIKLISHIGVALYPTCGADSEELLEAADEALHRARQQGPNSFQFYSRELNAQSVENQSVEASLCTSIERGELSLVYQPILDMTDHRLMGVEALLRWQHPHMGMMTPAQFLPVAEETGLILQIGRWVADKALSQLRDWRDQGMDVPAMTLNISALQLRQIDLVDMLAETLHRYNIKPESLILDIQESVVMDKEHDPSVILTKLKALGVRLAIDDFGTGYTSFGVLRRMPIDILKIDGAFVREAEGREDDARMVSAVAAIAKSLQLLVLAEGVETEGQATFLAKLGCNLGQGFFLGSPAPELTALLNHGVK